MRPDSSTGISLLWLSTAQLRFQALRSAAALRYYRNGGRKQKRKNKRMLISLMAVERQISLSLSCLVKD